LHHEKKIRTFYYTNIFKFKFEAVSMVSGNGMTHLYFKGPGGWHEPASFEQISHHSLLLDELRFRPEVDLVVARGLDGSLHLLSEMGHAALTYSESEKMFTYKIIASDPLELFPQKSTQFLPLHDTLKLTINTRHPDVFVQLWQVFLSQRCGDVIVTSKTGFDLRKKFEHPLHKASHGSLTREHMLVPLISNVSFGSEPLRSVDVHATVKSILGI
jgi:hypothetical protein